MTIENKHKPKLTAKQQMFIKEYVIDFNATQACIRAGYSKHTAKEQGAQNLTKLNIQEEIKKLQEKREEKLEITAESVVNRINEVIVSCLSSDKPEHSSALKGLELLGRHLGMFIDRKDITTKGESINSLHKLLINIDGNTKTFVGKDNTTGTGEETKY